MLGLTLGDVLGDVGGWPSACVCPVPEPVPGPAMGGQRCWRGTPLPWGSCSCFLGMSWHGGRSPLADRTWGHWEALGGQERRGPRPGLPRLSPALLGAACVCPAVPPTVVGPQVSRPRGPCAVARPWANGPTASCLCRAHSDAGHSWWPPSDRLAGRLQAGASQRLKNGVCVSRPWPPPAIPALQQGSCSCSGGLCARLLGARGRCGERSPPPLAVASTVGCLALRCPPSPALVGSQSPRGPGGGLVGVEWAGGGGV